MSWVEHPADRAVAEAERGDFRPLQRLLQSLPPDQAELLTTPAVLAGLSPRSRIPVNIAALAQSEASHPIVCAALGSMARTCALSFDRTGLQVLSAALPALPAEHPAAALVRGWSALADGDADAALREAESAESLAASAGRAIDRIDASALRALAVVIAGDTREALRVARRGSRMAAAEEMPQGEYLANIVLARTRRVAGESHLATRILTALLRFAPPPWHPWIHWELTMALGALDGGGDGPAHGLEELLRSASSGDLQAFRDRAARLHETVTPWYPLLLDARRITAALDPFHESTAVDPEVMAWRLGGEATPPHGLAGVVHDAQQSLASVIVWPDRRSTRVLQPGVAMALPTTEPAASPAEARKHNRTDTLLAALALEQHEELDELTLFRAVYGFDYDRSLHANVFNVLFHRARARLADRGTVERADGKVSLCVERITAIVDPRCARSQHDRLLRYMTQHEEISARDAAKALGLSLRSVQASLEGLLEDGACVQERKGRHVAYKVEDTTFQVPTRWNLE